MVGVVNSFPVFGLVAAHGFFWIDQLVEDGVLTRAEGPTHRLRRSLTNALIPSLGSPPNWDSGRVALEPGDQIVIVTLNLSWIIEKSGENALDEFPASAEDCARNLLALDRPDPEPRGSYAIVLELTQ